MEIVERNGVRFLKSELFDGIKHGFSLRQGGVSRGDFGTLNVGLRRGDAPFDVIANIEKCLEALNMNKDNLTMTYQTHTANVRFLAKEDLGKGFIREWGEGVDGVVTDMEHVPIMCYSADCVPTLLYDKKRRMIGAIHGGWRGTAENIILNAVNVMENNGSRIEDVAAFVGPAIGMCCYEVSEDVGEAFAPLYGNFVKKSCCGKYMIDLKGITTSQLERAGVKRENIENCNICTSCANDMFFSHRKQKGNCGLLGGFIQLG